MSKADLRRAAKREAKREAKRKTFFTALQPILGYETTPRSRLIGFTPTPPQEQTSTEQIALHRGKSHLMTIGSTGSGKSILAIANGLSCEASMIFVDTRGDIAAATARFRCEMLGQDVYFIDPWNLVTKKTDRLDPCDVATLPRVDIESEAQTIAAMLGAGHAKASDVYWPFQGMSVISADVSHFLSQADPEKRSFNRLIDLLFHEESVYEHAGLLDKEVAKPSFAYAGIAAFLNLPDSSANTRFCVLSTAQSMCQAFRSPAIRSAMGSSTIPLVDLMNGKPMTIYLVMPVERLASHGVCLRLWLDVLLQALLRRTTVPRVPTLVMVDEAAQIGPSPALLTIATYLRANGVRLWSYFQDAAQLKHLYENNWQTLVNNTSVLTFLPGSHLMARELAEIVGTSAAEISQLRENEQLVCETGRPPRVVRSIEYWKDPMFDGRWDPLQRYGQSPGRE